MTRRAAVLLTGVLVLVAGVSCRSNTSDPPGSSEALPELRHDLAPLTRRVRLPPAVSTANWWAEPQFTDSGWLPTPDAPYRLVAWLPMAVPVTDPVDELEVLIDLPRAHHLLPEAHWRNAPIRDGKVVLKGQSVTPPIESLDADVGVVHAAWLDGGLWLELFQRAD